MGREPACIVRLGARRSGCITLCSGGSGVRLLWLGLGAGGLGLLGSGEEGGDPGGVDKVAGAAKSSAEDEVEEDTGEGWLLACFRSCGRARIRVSLQKKTLF